MRDGNHRPALGGSGGEGDWTGRIPVNLVNPPIIERQQYTKTRALQGRIALNAINVQTSHAHHDRRFRRRALERIRNRRLVPPHRSLGEDLLRWSGSAREVACVPLVTIAHIEHDHILCLRGVTSKS